MDLDAGPPLGRVGREPSSREVVRREVAARVGDRHDALGVAGRRELQVAIHHLGRHGHRVRQQVLEQRAGRVVQIGRQRSVEHSLQHGHAQAGIDHLVAAIRRLPHLQRRAPAALRHRRANELGHLGRLEPVDRRLARSIRRGVRHRRRGSATHGRRRRRRARGRVGVARGLVLGGSDRGAEGSVRGLELRHRRPVAQSNSHRRLDGDRELVVPRAHEMQQRSAAARRDGAARARSRARELLESREGAQDRLPVLMMQLLYRRWGAHGLRVLEALVLPHDLRQQRRVSQRAGRQARRRCSGCRRRDVGGGGSSGARGREGAAGCPSMAAQYRPEPE